MGLLFMPVPHGIGDAAMNVWNKAGMRAISIGSTPMCFLSPSLSFSSFFPSFVDKMKDLKGAFTFSWKVSEVKSFLSLPSPWQQLFTFYGGWSRIRLKSYKTEERGRGEKCFLQKFIIKQWKKKEHGLHCGPLAFCSAWFWKSGSRVRRDSSRIVISTEPQQPRHVRWLARLIPRPTGIFQSYFERNPENLCWTLDYNHLQNSNSIIST